MTAEQFLYMNMVERGMDINPGTLDSLREAIEEGNIYFFEDEEGSANGFVTWYFEGDKLVMNNLCMWGENGRTKLFILRNILHTRYPDLKAVKWFDERRKRIFETRFKN